MAGSSFSTAFRVDTSDLRALARDLERTVPGVRREVSEVVIESGQLVAAEARTLSSWSSRIPGSIRVAGTLNRSVVRAGGEVAPHAPAFEHGGRPGEFRHPVFGNRNVWVGQRARPFLAPALEAKAAAMERRLHQGVDEVFRSVRL